MEILSSVVTSVVSDGGLTILSVVVAFLASALTLELIVRTANSGDRRQIKKNRVASSLALGLGLWAMFQVSFALQSSGYYLWGTFLPMAMAVGISSLATGKLALPSITNKRLIEASLILGMGVPLIVLVGLLFRQSEGHWHFHPLETIIALGVAIVLSYLSLVLVLHPGIKPRYPFSVRHLLATLLLGGGLTFSLFIFSDAVFYPIFQTQPPVSFDEGHTIATLCIAFVLLLITSIHYSHLSQERDQHEKNIRDLYLAQDIAHMGNWDWNLETDTITCSSQLAHIFGRETINNPVNVHFLTEAVHPSDRIDVKQCHRQARNDPKGQWSIRYRIIRPGGDVRMVREHGRTLTNKYQHPGRLLATVADVTHIYDMEKREERVMQSQIALSALLETGLEPLTLDKQLHVALHIIMTVPWLSVQYQGSIFLVEPESGDLVLASHIGLSEIQTYTCSRVKKGFCLCGQSLLKREIIFSSQIDERHTTTYQEIQPHGHYCVPIISRNRVLGVLNLYVPDGYKKNLEEDAFLTTISNTLAGLIDLRHTEAQLRDEREFIATVLRTAPSLVVVLDLEGKIILFNHACQALTGYTEEDVAGRPIWDFLVPEEEHTEVKRRLQQIEPGGKPLDHEGYWLTKGGIARLIAWSNTVIAHIDDSKRHIIGTGIDITEKRQSEQRLHFLANHDPLTGLPNRMQFMEHLSISIAQARRSGLLLAVMFMDLDRFKAVNDTLGHEVGDYLLINVAQRIRTSVREMDVVARLGGDEFTVLMTGLADIDSIGSIARKIIYNLEQIFEVGTHKCQIGSSIGISFFPQHGDDPQILLKKADQAMYFVKESGKNNFKVWDETC